MLTMIGFFLYLFYPIILRPNAYFFGSSGDGLKNYFSFTYYVQNNHSWTNFEGMNYPFGESVFYTDGHPLLAVIIKGIGYLFPSILSHSVGIINLLLLASLIVTVVYLFKIIRHFSIHPTIALFGAFAITLLSPQNGRLSAHYALAYSCAIPMIIYFLILYYEKIKCWKNGIIISLLCFVFFETHAYLGVICAGIVLLFAFTLGVKNSIKKESIRQSLWLFLIGIIPIVLFFSIVKLTDQHSGRTTNPWGIYENHAELSTLFLPYITENMIAVFPFLKGILQPWEGRAYIGFGTIITLIILLIRFVYFRIKSKENSQQQKQIPAVFNYLLICSVVLLLFSLFIPFRFGYDDLLEQVAIIKQFRAIGRFVWPFYFVATLLYIIIGGKIYQYYQLKNNNKTAFFIGFLFPFLLFFEGHDSFVEQAKLLSLTQSIYSNDPLSKQSQPNFSTLPANKYQAILTLPYYTFGSDNLGINGSDKVYKWSFKAAQELKLPLLESYLTRLSIGESKMSMQLMSADFYKKEIEHYIPSKKPFLVIYTHDELTEKGTNLLKKCRVLSKGKEIDVLEISYNDLFYNSSNKEWKNYQSKKNTLFKKNGFLVSDTNSFFQFEGFSKDLIPALSAKKIIIEQNQMITIE